MIKRFFHIKIFIVISFLTYSAILYAATTSSFLFLNESDLVYVAKQIELGNKRYLPAYKNLISNADKVLNKTNGSVMDKKLIAPSQDKHDYFSLSPYWWPNPQTKDGLPYIRRDGESNPAANNDDTDKLSMNRLSRDVYILSLAYYFTKKPVYAEKATSILVTWFIDPATRMNPNMNYAQTLYEAKQVRGYGIIDGRVLINIIDAIELIKPAKVMTHADEQALTRWFGAFYHWIQMSDNGKLEQKRTNNHGSYVDLQAAAYAAFSDQAKLAKAFLLNVKNQRITEQFATNGEQKQELLRTRSWHYSNFNLQAYNQLGRLGEQLNINLWQDTRLKQGYLFIADYIDSNKKWPYPEKEPRDLQSALVNMLVASHVYNVPIFR